MRFDVVIPSRWGRLESVQRSLGLRVDRPGVEVRFHVVVDRDGEPPKRLLDLAGQREDLVVIHSGTNEGASRARNRGLGAGDGDFVVFLDDDVVPDPNLLNAYVDAIEADDSDAPGYVGVTRFPPPHTSFERGVVASDILTFFDLGSRRPRMSWGVTANLCLRRSRLGDLRFSAEFPKAGGGEDIDLCLQLHDGCTEPFVTVPAAVVVHPWWDIGRGSYKRFARWAFGDGRLPQKHPRFRYLNFPTLPETLLLIALLRAVRGQPIGLPSLVALGLVVEVGVDFVKLRSRGADVSLEASIEGTLVRLSNDIGRLVGNLVRGRPHAIGERFDYFCTGESIRGERLVAGAKAGLLGIALWLLGEKKS